MHATEWYRNTEWTPDVSKEFEQRLSRARGQRAEYLRIQALTLANTLKPEYASVAIALARRHIELAPQDIFAAQLYATIARALESLGELPAVVGAYKSAVELEHQRPNVRGHHYLDFTWFVATHKLSAHYQDALTAIKQNKQDQDLVFPINQYRYFASLAIISLELGDHETANQMAKNAFKSAAKGKGPFWRYPQLGVVNGEKDALRARLENLFAGHST